MKKEPYHPISCDFHSELELLAMRGTACEIVYLDEKDQTRTITDQIADLYTRRKEEFLLLRNGLTIRLDRLVSVNGMALKNYC